MLDFRKQHRFLIAIDSDGCVFDTMELKHKECFIPNIVLFFHLQAISKFVREAAEYVNLYSPHRGINRFVALVETLDLVAKHPDVITRGVHVNVPDSLRHWVAHEKSLSNTSLSATIRDTADEALQRCLEWSDAVNAAIEVMVHNVPPFPYVKKSLQKLHSLADMIVCSATPTDTLRREWHEHGIDKYVTLICGQEHGTKREILQIAKNYEPHCVLMIGDAPSDCSAAQDNQSLFFPIIPGQEVASWQHFLDVGIEKLLHKNFAGDYQQRLIEKYFEHLQANPPWKAK